MDIVIHLLLLSLDVSGTKTFNLRKRKKLDGIFMFV